MAGRLKAGKHKGIALRIEEYLETLPVDLLGGDGIELSEKSLEEIFRFARLDNNDTFFHLGCGSGTGVQIAAEKFGAKRSVGVDLNPEMIDRAKKRISERDDCDVVCMDAIDADISDATVILSWFTEDDTIDALMKKFEGMNPGIRIITVWGPLPGCIPDDVRFPYILNKVPFKKGDVREQMRAVLGVECVDFVTAWEFAERYTKALGGTVRNDRFLTIIQTLTIWINAKNLGISCGNSIPEPISTYIGIMKTQFGIDFDHLLE